MRIEIAVDTKWHGCNETLIVDTNELGYSDEAWDNMSEDQRQDEILQVAYDAIGFSFNYDYVE